MTTTHDTQQLLLPLPGGQSDVAAATAAAPKFNVVHWPLFANQHTDTHTHVQMNTLTVGEQQTKPKSRATPSCFYCSALHT